MPESYMDQVERDMGLRAAKRCLFNERETFFLLGLFVGLCVGVAGMGVGQYLGLV